MPVCAIKRNNAEERIRAMVGDGSTLRSPRPEAVPSLPEPEPKVSIQFVARDQLRARVARCLKGEDFERLAFAIFTAQGYVTARTDAGADGGLDIVARRGPMGFEPPSPAVQVKFSENPEGERCWQAARRATPLQRRPRTIRELGRLQGERL